jgi:hypothetical protein
MSAVNHDTVMLPLEFMTAEVGTGPSQSTTPFEELVKLQSDASTCGVHKGLFDSQKRVR